MALNLQIRTLKPNDNTVGKIEAWLADQDAFRGMRPSLQDISHIKGSGSANETLAGWLFRGDGEAASRHQVVLRLLDPGSAPYLDARLDRQVAIIRWIEKSTGVPVPKVVTADLAGEAVGRPFLMMEYIEGQAANDYPGYNIEGFLVAMSPTERHKLWRNSIKTLAELHKADISSLDFLDFPGTVAARLPDLVAHWEHSLDWVGEGLPDPYFREVIEHLQATIPATAPEGLSWGDARIGNLLFRDEAVVAVLDWEMASCGGPLVDLAWWLLFDRIQDEDLGVPRLPGLGTRDETIELWQNLTGLSACDLHWHEVLASFQLSVTRAKAFHDRLQAGLPVPSDDDPRSVLRLKRRLERLLG